MMRRTQWMVACAAGSIVALTMPETLFAGTGSTGNCDPPNVQVRAKMRMRNTSGMDANDFHFYMYQNDKDSVVVNGAEASCSNFGTVGVSLGTDNGQTPPPPPGNHGAQVDMSGGTVADGEQITVEMTLCMNERNCLKVKDAEFTKDGSPIGGAKPQQGFRVKRPRKGGDGGSNAPDGGGRGAQEGSGGSGNWIHDVCIENDDVVPMVLEELKLLASTTYYPDIEAIDWPNIAPIQNAAGEPPVCIYANDAWCYEFNTTGSYVNGHIYMKYTLRPAVSGECGLPSPANGVETATDEDVLTFGDHPVDEVQTDILIGDDFWHTLDAAITFGTPEIPPVPPDFFYPGSEPFTGTVPLEGLIIDPQLGDADTIIARKDDPALPSDGATVTIPIQIVALHLQSVAPIEVGGDPWMIDVMLGDPPSAEGSMNVTRINPDGGVFDMQSALIPQILFTPLLGGPPLEYPNTLLSPLNQQSGSDQWMYEPPPFTIPGSGPNFFAPWDSLMPFGSPSLQQVLTPAKPPAPGDFDLDGDVDLSDYGQFLDCYNGPGNPPAQPDCDAADFDLDRDVDLSDYGQFLDCYNGPSKPPACF
jgi:hypothetical protein